MPCQDCGAETVTFAVPESLREHVPEDTPAVAVCTTCLARAAVHEVPADEPDFGRIHADFPTGPGAAPAALAVSLLDSLALYRADIEALVAAAEAEGVDVLLLVDRLAASGAIDTDTDLERRRHQLEQFLA
jgi:hypothetical protein